MVAAAPGLNGARIHVPNSPEVWLVYHGTRHHITSPAAYEALFASTDDLLAMESVDQIMRGCDLTDGVCLVKAEGDGAIYLVAGFPDTDIRKHYICSFETFQDFAFDMSKVRTLPRLVVAGLTLGRDIRSAAESAS